MPLTLIIIIIMNAREPIQSLGYISSVEVGITHTPRRLATSHSSALGRADNRGIGLGAGILITYSLKCLEFVVYPLCPAGYKL